MSGAHGDLEYDDITGNLYVLDRDLWVIDDNRNSRVLFDGNFSIDSGLDIIIPEPSTSMLLAGGSLMLIAMVSRKRPTIATSMSQRVR